MKKKLNFFLFSQKFLSPFLFAHVFIRYKNKEKHGEEFKNSGYHRGVYYRKSNSGADNDIGNGLANPKRINVYFFRLWIVASNSTRMSFFSNQKKDCLKLVRQSIYIILKSDSESFSTFRNTDQYLLFEL
ncbi:hypothetical protein IE90_04645 [Sanguibacteroides justesenii]|uniref:Uncharacterized protein n=1 Tax=Sanguibacteroides justesenii TaxID=1547597 RepID=A0AB34R4Y6_9PORP|nr:hypothetical protein IE90_04645 [Sanguibacteroides justesenii]